MEYLAEFRSDGRAVSPADPSRYVREADLALLYGSRELAVALIARAYLAYDLLLADCDDFTNPGKEWPERSK
jgi:hypothetical protein